MSATLSKPLNEVAHASQKSQAAQATQATLAAQATQATQAAQATVALQPSPTCLPSSRTLLGRELRHMAIKIGAIVGIVALLFTFVFGLHYNVDADMNPAIKDGDLVLFNRWDKDYRAGDLIVLTFKGQPQVRRVIAVAGDTVDILKEGLTINGALQQEQGIYEATQRYAGGADFPITLQANEIFVLGDARGGATDSRIYGSVDTDDTQGTVMTLLRRRSL
ncbi:MAG: signal peptidase I [Coriobacteriia bacterium]|nr:signal peptidase I [Coriobacteriia bacterium]